jgi:O-antigen/teichoic acid export membrane protein
MRRTRAAVLGLTSSRLVRHTGWTLGGQVTRAGLQATFFVLAARGLGVDGFGAFASAVAFVALASPFGSLGALSLMLRHVARRPESAPEQYATAVLVTVVSGLGITGVLALAASWVVPPRTGTDVILWLAAGDLLAFRLVELSGAIGQAQDEIRGTAVYPCVMLSARLVAVGLLFPAGFGADLEIWAAAYGVSSVAVAVPVVVLTVRQVGSARPIPRQFLVQWREGLLFSVGLAAQGVYNDIDKVMLARLGPLEAVGVYAAAYRVVDMAFIPMRALLTASYARFFRAGDQGLAGSVTLARRLMLPSLGIASVATLVLLLGADVIALVLGPGFAATVGILRMLAVIPVLRALHYLAADALTGAGLQGVRTAVQFGVAGANMGLNLLLIPMLGVHGAVAASIVCDAALALVLWAVVGIRLRSSAPNHQCEAEVS